MDTARRTVTVEGPDGKTITLDAKNARNLDQVGKKGDTSPEEKNLVAARLGFPG